VSEDRVQVLVRYDGRGFDAASLAPGFGLNSVAARVAQFGGTWSIDSAPAAGTTVSALLPLPQNHSSGPVDLTVRWR
jgi:signal transduction histidine kinase